MYGLFYLQTSTRVRMTLFIRFSANKSDKHLFGVVSDIKLNLTKSLCWGQDYACRIAREKTNNTRRQLR